MQEAQGLIIRSDGSFFAHLGDIDSLILKSQKIGDTEGWHFKAIASTASKDRDGEVMLQKGLDFSPFKDSGEFNWNHISHALVGVPYGDKAWFDKSTSRWMCEGLLLKGMPIWDGYDSDMVVKQHNQFAKAQVGRGLCTSIEGKVIERSDCGKYVKKAKIYNVALTFRPVNPDCTLNSLNALAKSMDHQLPIVCDNEFYKSMGNADIAAFVKQDVEGGDEESLEKKLVKHLVRKGYSDSQAKRHVASYFSKKFSVKG